MKYRFREARRRVRIEILSFGKTATPGGIKEKRRAGAEARAGRERVQQANILMDRSQRRFAIARDGKAVADE